MTSLSAAHLGVACAVQNYMLLVGLRAQLPWSTASGASATERRCRCQSAPSIQKAYPFCQVPEKEGRCTDWSFTLISALLFTSKLHPHLCLTVFCKQTLKHPSHLQLLCPDIIAFMHHAELLVIAICPLQNVCCHTSYLTARSSFHSSHPVPFLYLSKSSSVC